jgi:hypothetical protein
MLFSLEVDQADRLKIEKSWRRMLANAAWWTESVQRCIHVNGNTSTKPRENLMWMTVEVLLDGDKAFST